MDSSSGQVLCATALHHTSQSVHLDRASEIFAPHLVEFVHALNVHGDSQQCLKREKLNPHETSEIQTLNSTQSDTVTAVSYWAHSRRVSHKLRTYSSIVWRPQPSSKWLLLSLSQHCWLSQINQLFPAVYIPARYIITSDVWHWAVHLPSCL